MSEMGDATSLKAFLHALQQSRLFDAGELARLAAQAQPTSAATLADRLIHSGELTHYQADKLLRGRWQGLVLGPYSVLAPLGRGGMGTVVYLARDRRLSESLGDTVLVALKLLPGRKADAEPRTLARFRREMELGRLVDHPNVVRTLAAGEIENVHYLALEFVSGQSLRQLVAQHGPLPVGVAARIASDVAAGLQHVHDRGLVHRDVKPANVMIRPDGRAIVLDLGLAIQSGEPLPDDPTIIGGRGYVVGTMDYLAPEQAVNAVDVGPAADLYGLGCTLFFALTGGVPYPAGDVREKVRRHRDDPLPPLPGVPENFAELVYSLMAKSQAARPASAKAVRELLLPFVAAYRATAVVDVLAQADQPNLDAGLWEATPGEELPWSANDDPSPRIARLDEAETNDSLEVDGIDNGFDSEKSQRDWLLLGLFAALMFFALCVALIRWL